jgi:hypothetical protein
VKASLRSVIVFVTAGMLVASASAVDAGAAGASAAGRTTAADRTAQVAGHVAVHVLRVVHPRALMHVAARPGTVISGTSFNGNDQASSDCACLPPDPSAAIGPDDVVEVTDGEWAVYDTGGDLLGSTGLNSFFGTSDSLSDARVIYDPTWKQWEMSADDLANGFLLTAYSNDSNPFDGWLAYDTSFGSYFMQGVRTGMNDEAFFYTANLYSGGTYSESIAFSFPKVRMFNGYPPPYASTKAFLVDRDTTPAVVGGDPTDFVNYAYMLAPNLTNQTMDVYDWTSTSESNATMHVKGSIAYAWTAATPAGQPGTTSTLDVGDGAISQVSQLNNRLWFAHTVSVSGYATVEWGFVSPTTMTITAAYAYHSGSSYDFDSSITAERDPVTNRTQEVLNWVTTDPTDGLPASDVYVIHRGVAVPTETGADAAYSPAGGVGGTDSNDVVPFGGYSSVAVDYQAVGSCAAGTVALVTNEYLLANGHWRTRLAQVRSAC